MKVKIDVDGSEEYLRMGEHPELTNVLMPIFKKGEVSTQDIEKYIGDCYMGITNADYRVTRYASGSSYDNSLRILQENYGGREDYKEYLEKMRQWAKERGSDLTQMTLMDAGCGKGVLANLWAKHFGKIVIFDIDFVEVYAAAKMTEYYGNEGKIEILVSDFVSRLDALVEEYKPNFITCFLGWGLWQCRENEISNGDKSREKAIEMLSKYHDVFTIVG